MPRQSRFVATFIAAAILAGAVACNGGGSDEGSTVTPGGPTSTPGAVTPIGTTTPRPDSSTPSGTETTAIQQALGAIGAAVAAGDRGQLRSLIVLSRRDEEKDEALDDVLACLAGLQLSGTPPNIELRGNDERATVTVYYIVGDEEQAVRFEVDRQEDGTWLLAKLPVCPRPPRPTPGPTPTKSSASPPAQGG